MNTISTAEVPQGAVVNFARSQNDHPVVAYESAFLGAIMTGTYRLSHDFGLSPEDFLVPCHKVIWGGILELLQSGSITDAGALYTWAESKGLTAEVGGYHYVRTQLRDADPLTLDANFATSKILDASRVRRVRDALQDAIRYLDSNKETPGAELSSEVEKRIFESTQYLATVGVTSMPSSLPGYREEFKRKVALGGRPIGIPIGLGPLDAILGGFKKGTLNGLMAAPGQGKSAAMTNAVSYLGNVGAEVVIFSLEMQRGSLIDRVIAAHGEIPLNDVQNGNPARAADVLKAIDELNGCKTIHMGDAPSMTLQQISSELRRLKAERGRIDLVWIDHLHIIERGSMDYSGFLAVTKGLKQLAVELDCAIIGLLHLNAGIASRQDKRPQTSDIKFLADGDFDVIVGLYRDEVYNPHDTEEPGLAEFLVRKHRNGKTGVAKVMYIREMTKFKTVFPVGESESIILPWEVDGMLIELDCGKEPIAIESSDPMGDGHIEYGNVEQPTRVDFATLLAEKFGREEPAYPDEYPMPEQVNENLTPISTDGINDFFDDQFSCDEGGYLDEF